MTPESRLFQQQSDDRLFELLMQISGKLDTLNDDHAATRDMLETHMRGEEQLMTALREAFPGGDPASHRRYHEEVMSQIASRKEFWRRLSFELAKWGLIGFCGWLIIQVWHGALRGPG